MLDLDEEGSEIKSATVIEGEYASSPPKQINFNRPFIYFVREKTTGAVLIAGVYALPE